MSAERNAGGRNARLFRESRRLLKLETKAITHRNAARGLLKSGGTIKEIVRALDEKTVAALTDALGGIAAITDHAGPKRNRLIDQLQANLVDHQESAKEIVRVAIERIGLGSDFTHALSLIEEAQLRHREMIADFGEGWTAPMAKPWKDRHPLLFALMVAVIGAIIGVVGKSLADRVLEPHADVTATVP